MAINDNEKYTLTGAQIKDLAAKINGKPNTSDILVYEKFFEYEADTTYSTTVNVDVPIDLSEYREIKIEMFAAASTGASGWGSATARTEAEAIQCHQTGIEMEGNTTLVGVNRDMAQIVAWGVDNAQSAQVFITIKKGNNTDYPQYRAEGYGAGTGQWFQGRVNTAPQNIKYVRIPLLSPTVGSWVRAYGVR